MKMNLSKSRLGLIAGSICCFLLALSVYFFGGITEELTDALSYRQDGNGGKITNETTISQSFVCPYDQVKAMTLRISTFQTQFEKGKAILVLTDETGQEIDSQETELVGVTDKGPVTFTFSTPIKGKGKSFTLTASGENIQEEQAYSLMIGQSSVGGLLTTAEGKTSDKSSLFMTVTYLNPIKAIELTFFFIIVGVILLALVPMATGKKEAK